jgi:uncharacterized protein with NRDE domain
VCTLALAFRLFTAAPLLVAANRDEHYDRPSAAPYLADGEPKILAGRDLRAGGTWLGVNENGLLVGILNRRANGDPFPAANLRSRGLLCMDSLAHDSAIAAAAFIQSHDSSYSPFTVVCADQRDAFVAYNQDGSIQSHRLDAGVYVFSSAADGDIGSPKAERAQEKFAHALEGFGADGAQSSAWLAPLQKVLADHELSDGSKDPGNAICVHRETTGTVSSSVVVYSASHRRFEMFYCAGAPCQNDFGDPLPLGIR